MFGKKINQLWLPLTGIRFEITYISASIHDSNEIPTAIPMFSRSVQRPNYSEDCQMCGLGINQRWLPLTGSRYEIKYIFTFI